MATIPHPNPPISNLTSEISNALQRLGFHAPQTPRHTSKLIAWFAFCPAESGFGIPADSPTNDSPGILRIAFQGNLVKDYHQVPESIYQGLLAADSAGRYWHESIAPQEFIVTLVSGERKHRDAVPALSDANWLEAWELSIDLMLSQKPPVAPASSRSTSEDQEAYRG